MIYRTTGHHGTDKQSGYSILDSNFNVSQKSTLWLGEGVYFFENDPKMALAWCEVEGYRRKYNEYVILISDIRVKENELLDLDNPQGQKLFHGHRDIVMERLNRAHFSVGTRNRESLDGKLINEICSFLPYKVIRLTCFVAKAKDRIRREYSSVPNCIMICVRDVEHIISTDLFEEGVLNAG